MNYIDEIFLRGNIQQIREFLLHGVTCDTDPRSYIERLETADRKVTARLLTSCSTQKEYEEISKLVYEFVSTVEDVYMEIGLQMGAILTAQVCQNFKTAFERE